MAGCAGSNERKAEVVQQQEGHAPQQRIENGNLKPLAECADGGGGHWWGALKQDSNGKKIVFASMGPQTILGIYTIESVLPDQPSIEMYAINSDGTGLTQLTEAAATEIRIPNGYPDGRDVKIAWARDSKIDSIHYNVARNPQYGEEICSLDGKKLASVTADTSSGTPDSNGSGSAAPEPDTDILVRNSANTVDLGDTGYKSTETWPVFSPDSKKIAFVREETTDRGTSTNVYVANADGSNQTNLTQRISYGSTPLWLDDNERIAFISDGHIYTINADGTDLTRLTDKTKVIEGELFLSPDHKKLAFLGLPAGGSDTPSLYVINTDGTGLTPLANEVTSENISVWTLVPPFYSPDSMQIAFVLTRSVPFQPVTYDLYVVNVDGTGLTRLTNNKNAEGIITWAGP